MSLVNYSHHEGVAQIKMDDGKANVMSNDMLKELNAALNQAEAESDVLILTGREKMFSGGFDLATFKRGDAAETLAMLSAGAELTHRLLSFPKPIITACSGHAVAMGFFTLLSTDYRIGMEGDSKFAANEVAIGMTVPYFATQVCLQRLSAAALNQGLGFATYFDTSTAVAAGIVDELTPVANLETRAQEKAGEFLKLDLEAHAATKARYREALLSSLREAIERDKADWGGRY